METRDGGGRQPLKMAIVLLASCILGPAMAIEELAARRSIVAIRSQTWQLDAICDGQDLWKSWTINSHPPTPNSWITPWLDRPIDIIGIEMVKVQTDVGKPDPMNATTSWFMVGSTIQPDAMLWIYPGQTGASRMTPPGTGYPWPSKDKARPAEPRHNEAGELFQVAGELIVVHGLCFGGGPVTIMLTVYFVTGRQADAQR
jgi:hypothetical protein